MQYVNPNLLTGVKARIYGATQNSAFASSGSPGQPGTPGAPSVPGQPGPTPGYTGTPGTGTQGTSAGSMGAMAGVTGAVGAAAGAAGGTGPGTGKVYEVSKPGGTSTAAGGLPVYAVVGVIILVALVGAGYLLAGRKVV